MLAIEILSPDDRINRVIPRLQDFLQMGVENVWLIDPIDRVAYTYGPLGLNLADTPILSIPNSPIYLDLPEIFSALD